MLLPILNLQTSATSLDRQGSLPPAPRSLILLSYFRSGWAFFIPYLGVYLLYAWTKWPVNPEIVGAGSTEQGARSSVPCLLHVYWVMHGIHLVLGAIALRSWWKESILNLKPSTSTGALSASPSSSAHLSLDTLYRLLPWICLALIFWIPGIYLEWPSDSWEHLRRINEWHILDQVIAHSSWKKFSYFLPFSLTGHGTGSTQLGGLGIYYTSIALLLAWQYYKLAIALQLNISLALFTAISTPLLLGNSSFSFWQYYGLSSSILGQIAVITALRWAITVEIGTITPSSLGIGIRLITTIVPIGALLIFALLSHPQAFISAVLGLALMLSWRWSLGRLVRLTCLIGGLIVASMLVTLTLTRSPHWSELVESAGWTGPGGGFALLDPRSPAFERALLIIGGFGFLNLAAALYLTRENHPASWLVLGPLALLACPVVAIPLLNVLIADHQPILVFHRILFMIPPTIAVAIVSDRLVKRFHARLPATQFILLIIILLALLVVPISRPTFNRIFNLCAYHHEPELVALAAARTTSSRTPHHSDEITALPSVVFGLQALMPESGPSPEREIIDRTPARNAETALQHLIFSSQPERILTFDALLLSQPQSMMGFVTDHWYPNHLAMHLAGQHEMLSYATDAGGLSAEYHGFNMASLGANSSFLEAFHQVTLSPGEIGPISLNPPPGHNKLIMLAGHVTRGSAYAAGFEPSALTVKESVPYRLLRNQSSGGVLRLETSPDFAFHLERLQARQSVKIITPVVDDDPFAPVEVLANMKIHSQMSPGGLFVNIKLDPNSSYRFELRGTPAGTAASLRLRASIDGHERLKYLSLAHQGVQFTVSRLDAIELLIFQDTPFDYFLRSLSFAKKQVTFENESIFSLSTN